EVAETIPCPTVRQDNRMVRQMVPGGQGRGPPAGRVALLLGNGPRYHPIRGRPLPALPREQLPATGRSIRSGGRPAPGRSRGRGTGAGGRGGGERGGVGGARPGRHPLLLTGRAPPLPMRAGSAVNIWYTPPQTAPPPPPRRGGVFAGPVVIFTLVVSPPLLVA